MFLFFVANKYLSGQTSISTTTKSLQQITYPSLTICRGLKQWGMWQKNVAIFHIPIRLLNLGFNDIAPCFDFDPQP